MDLYEDVNNLLHGRYDNKTISNVAKLCHTYAYSYLKLKVKQGALPLNQIDSNLEDLAWECIAELFARNNIGEFYILCTYFEDLPLNTDAQLRTHLRRLIFSKVNDGIFDHLRSFDSSMGKIIRNIKRVARESKHLTLKRRSGNLCVCYYHNAPNQKHSENENAPSLKAAPEIIEAWMSKHISKADMTGEHLDYIGEFFELNSDYRPEINVVDIARIIRNSYVYNNESDLYAEDSFPAGTFSLFQLEECMEEVICSQKDTYYNHYVNKKGFSLYLYDSLFHAIRDVLSANYIDHEKPQLSHYEFLKIYLPDIDRNTYRIEYRTYMEYLLKKCRSHFVEIIRNDIVRSSAV